MATRHFLSLLDLSTEELKQLLQRAIELKKMNHADLFPESLDLLLLSFVLGF